MGITHSYELGIEQN
ncbi:hypothetical protein MTR67_038362 [Solanum verrucosum]|uniref:Uncharacterized protein n=1 Tax=Solanum verrucosum TaxID=315347 RepID=A0AAF0UFC6_SOLVR|nr:hypothetical protein MTR67_038362 [Solanum verrucosum]